MKLRHLLPLLALSTAATLPAADAPPAAPAADFSAFKTADEFWAHFESLQKQPTEKPASREAAVVQAQAWFGAQQKAGEAFAKAFPEDARRWPAKLLALRAAGQMRRLAGQPTDLEAERTRLDEIISAADATKTVKSEAAFLRAMTLSAEFKVKPANYIAFHAAAADFAAKYADSPLAAQMQQLDLRVLTDDPTPQGAALLEKYAASADSKQAEAAQAIIARRQAISELRMKPVELAFTASNGKDVDLALMRGKVVLVEFWAATSAPSLAELQNVLAAYQELHPKGLEVVGISLDEDKDKMQEAVKKLGLPWPQSFEGTGMKNKIASKYGIEVLPASWLIDKKGMLRERGIGGPSLAPAVAKLLAE